MSEKPTNPLKIFCEGVCEIRVLKNDAYKSTYSGYFNSFEQALTEAARYDGLGNVYFVMNPVTPDVMSRRSAGKIVKVGQGETTKDADIAARRWLLFDFDPERSSGISATNEEKAAALAVMENASRVLAMHGFFPPVVCDSGNGYHLLYRIDLPNDADATKLVKDVLGAASLLFSTGTVKVDRQVFNAARITKFYGSLAVKGRNTDERPHRRSSILAVPERIEITPSSVLEDFVKAYMPEPAKREFAQRGAEFDLDRWLDEHGVRIRERVQTADGTRYVLEDGCPFNAEHRGRDAVLFRHHGGEIGFKCFHNSCANNHWREFRQLYEPDAYDKSYCPTAQEVFPKTISQDGAKTTSRGFPQFINPLEGQEARRRYTLDDIGAARLFADNYRDRLRYLPEYKNWFVYADGVWVQDSGDVLARRCAKRLADYVWSIVPPPPKPAQPGEEPEKDEFKDIRKHYAKYRSLNWRKTLLQDSQDELNGKSADFDRQPLYFNCLNGTLDLAAMKLRPHTPMDMLSKQACVNYDPAERCERFEQFIDEITEGDKDRARMLQKVLGYALKGEANEECYFNVVGEKTRNGKGTLFDTVLHLFGSYGAQIAFETIAKVGAKDGSRATPDLARLIGTRFVLTNEPDKGIFVNEALLKQITGNDDVIARPLYGAPIQFKPVFKLFITANSRPNVSDDSLFASGRVKVLPFPHHFTEEERDTSLKSKLRTPKALSGILNWLLQGYELYCAEGLRDTQEMRTLVEGYRSENDYVGQYLNERVTFTEGGPGGRITVRAMRQDYDLWCLAAKITPLGLKSFKQELEKKDIEVYYYGHVLYVNAALNPYSEFGEYNKPEDARPF